MSASIGRLNKEYPSTAATNQRILIFSKYLKSRIKQNYKTRRNKTIQARKKNRSLTKRFLIMFFRQKKLLKLLYPSLEKKKEWMLIFISHQTATLSVAFLWLHTSSAEKNWKESSRRRTKNWLWTAGNLKVLRNTLNANLFFFILLLKIKCVITISIVREYPLSLLLLSLG